MKVREGIDPNQVQIGSPYTQKKMMDFLNEARDRGLYSCITDNGAGGLSSSVGEMARKSGGFEMHLERVPLKYDGLDPWQILISESQERMTLAVDPNKYEDFEGLARLHGVELSVLGEFNDSGKFAVWHEETPVAYMDMDFVHKGVPKMELKAVWIPPESRGFSEPKLKPPKDYSTLILDMLERPNIASKEYIARQFDHEVQGTSVVKPLVGKDSDTFSDAAVVRPDLESFEGIAISAGLNPAYGEIDTYDMTALAIDEAIRRVIAVGGDLNQIALNDNFCWPSPLPDDSNEDAEYKMAQLVRANKALHDYTLGFGTPCVSGKDSMSMDGTIPDKTGGQQRISAPPTLQISAAGKMNDVRRAVTMDVKKPGDIIYVLGITKDELGGSEYYEMSGQTGLNVPKVNIKNSISLYNSLSLAVSEGLVASARGCYKGGLGIALAQSAFGGGYGFDVDLRKIPGEGLDRDDKILFSESAGRFVVTVSPDKAVEFEVCMEQRTFSRIGYVTKDERLRITGMYGDRIMDVSLLDLKSRWQKPFGV